MRNYCTGFQYEPVESCCEKHDKNYGKASKVSRSEADRELRECVIKTGRPVMAWVMWIGVRCFGWLFYKN